MSLQAAEKSELPYEAELIALVEKAIAMGNIGDLEALVAYLTKVLGGGHSVTVKAVRALAALRAKAKAVDALKAKLEAGRKPSHDVPRG